jgi:hypothetical protein
MPISEITEDITHRLASGSSLDKGYEYYEDEFRKYTMHLRDKYRRRPAFIEEIKGRV